MSGMDEDKSQQPGANGHSGQSNEQEEEQYELEYSAADDQGPDEIFLDDDDIAELKHQMEEEGDVPMDEDDDDVIIDDGSDDDADYQDVSSKQFEAHGTAVFTVSTHPVCPVLAVSGGEDDNGYIWRLDTGEQVAKLTGHTDSVISTGWSSDGELVATGGMDGRVRVWRRAVKPSQEGQWEWTRWEFLTVLEGMDEITWLDWHPKGAVLVCGTGDGTVWMWQLPSGRNMTVLSGHTAAVTCGRFLPDGKRIVTGSEDGTFVVWDPKTSSPVYKVVLTEGRFKLEGGITCVAVNASSAAAIVGGVDGALRIVNLTNGQVVQALESHESDNSVESVGWSQGTAGSVGLWVSVGTDKKVKVFEASNGSLRWSAEHDEAVTSLALHPQAPLLTTGSVDRSLKTWDLRTGTLQKTLTGHRDAIHTVAVSCDGKLLVSGSDDGTARVFEV